MLQPDQVTDSLQAYQLAKRGNSLRVMAEAVRWGKRGARVNTISPGIIFTPLATDELTGPRGAGYRRMLELSPGGAGRHPGRGRDRGRASSGSRRRVHHRQRRAHGRWRHRLLVLRRPRPTVIDQVRAANAAARLSIAW
jgi:NAD(P)-dependent dehydrogenase (short-subunit alcohol dehydrogenase family)